MNKFLKKEYDKTEKELSINNIFREMFALGLIENFENWVDYRELKNISDNEYNIENSNVIISKIPAFITNTAYLINKLDSVCS